MGPGKYDDLATAAMAAARAEFAAVIIIGGDKGNGFSVSMLDDPQLAGIVPNVLRQMADEMERSTRSWPQR